ncbi:MAG: type 4a pilus biogenesis protein PilO [Candidatus Omnitrophica bacterium]|nr:type 4a pilus biogenesis protein PilO [Candidatus Omnitrophota bacterium]MDD5737331.1 type 4a pilus biogenesis protein PilO [Candidatus Omnitrophota bacterium]
MPGKQAMSKEEMEKLVLIGIGVAIAFFALIQFSTLPMMRAIGKLNKDIVKEREGLKKADALIKSKPQLEKRLEALKGMMGQYDNAIPPNSEMPNILQEIAGFASESKVKISKIEPLRSEKPAEPAKAPKGKQPVKQEAVKKPVSIYTQIPIQVEAKGGYHAIGEFINRIETADNVMGIGDIDIHADPVDITNHSARLLIMAFVLNEEEPKK